MQDLCLQLQSSNCTKTGWRLLKQSHTHTQGAKSSERWTAWRGTAGGLGLIHKNLLSLVIDYQDEERQFVCLFGFLTSSSTTRLYSGRAPRQSFWQFYVLPHTRQSWETMTSVSAGHVILTPTQPVGSGQPQQESNPGPPHQESRALPTELPPPPPPRKDRKHKNPDRSAMAKDITHTPR